MSPIIPPIKPTDCCTDDFESVSLILILLVSLFSADIAVRGCSGDRAVQVSLKLIVRFKRLGLGHANSKQCD